MNILILINDAPYASERAYNALRIASSYGPEDEATVRVFLLGDGAWCAVQGLPVPEGRQDMGWMMERFLAGGSGVSVCGTCMDQRGIRLESIFPDAHRGTLQELKAWTREADRVLVF